MTPAVEKKEVDGVWIYVCKSCGEELVKIEPKGILGDGLNFIDVMVIQDHYFDRHTQVLR